METNMLLLAYYKDMRYIFGICPCCGEIFNLSSATIRSKLKPLTLPKYDHLLGAQEQIGSADEEMENIESRYHERFDALSMREEEYRANVEPEIIQKVRLEGRRQAMKRIKKIDKVFTKKTIDPRDVRLICSPVDFIAFNGMTEKKDIKSIEFISHEPTSSSEEKTVKSIEQLIKKGNMEFVLVRVSDTGAIQYDSVKRTAGKRLLT